MRKYTDKLRSVTRFGVSCYLVIFGFFIFTPHIFAKELNWIGHWKNELGREQLVEEVKKEFEFLHPDVNVNLVHDVDLDAPGDYFKKKVANTIVEMINSGNIKWDVVFLGITVYNYVAEILGDPDWGKKHLVDFSTVPEFFENHKEFIADTPYYKEQTGGIYVGPFIEGLITCLWYNKAVAAKVGIDVREEGMTASDFIGYAKKLSEYNRANNSTIPLLSFSTYYRIEGLFEFMFKSQLNDPVTVIEQSYSDEKARAFLDTLMIFEELSTYQPILNEGWRELGVWQWMDEYLKGNSSLFAAGGTYWYGHFMGRAPEMMVYNVPVEPPVVKYPNGLVGQYSNVWAVMKNSLNKKEAIELLQLWSEPKVAQKWIAYTKNPTGLRGNLASLELHSKEADVYSDFVVRMNKKYEGMQIRNFRSPTYLFGPDCQVSGRAFRESLALILEGKKGGREYFNEIMTLHNRQLVSP